MADQQTSNDGRTVGQLVAQLNDHLRTLLRYEIALAKAELRDGAKKGVVGAALLGGAGVLGFLALILLLIAAANGLVAAGLAPWGAFLVVAGVLLLVAAVLAAVGLSRVKKVKAPERTITTSKDTVAAVKGHSQAPGTAATAGSSGSS